VGIAISGCIGGFTAGSLSLGGALGKACLVKVLGFSVLAEAGLTRAPVCECEGLAVLPAGFLTNSFSMSAKSSALSSPSSPL